MRNSFFLIFSCLLLSAMSLQAQNLITSSNFDSNNRANYKAYESQVIDAVDWLEKTPFDFEVEKRYQVLSFLTKWAQGTPSMSVMIMPYAQKLSKTNNQFLGLFLGGWARYKIQNPSENNEKILNMAAIQTVLKSYKQGGFKDIELDKLLDLQSNRKLEIWISNQMNP
jgi:TPP-dependent 2-oxoacid decarboxylase